MSWSKAQACTSPSGKVSPCPIQNSALKCTPRSRSGQYQGLSQREIARMLGRSPSTISRELRRNRSLNGGYVAHVPSDRKIGHG
ncbi:helix-turn-helix domain-containing protein [Pseudomonas sp. MDT1-85]